MTAVLPATSADSLPPQGIYDLRLDRCVFEVAIRVLGRPVLRGRFRAVRGALTVGEDSALSVELSAKSLRTNVPLLHRRLTGPGGLWAARHRTIGFTGPVTPGGSRRLDIAGTVRIRHTDRPLSLRARVVHLDRDAVVLAVRGVLTADRFPRRRFVEAALELAR